ncbi:arsenic transporter [Microaerobacter geothermalis]|uniref:arsenic transporter n=1 Tax=Microaerobacter geothermalis TaxID=674972 RepID=UPI001F45DB99|nr:arsenic transporter [Microaerobacter geothermalis]MCF6093580.1 arsenic transporter [Microaerobacter geothermalis]
MVDIQTVFTLTIFFFTILFILWKPFGINEYVPTSIGAAILFAVGIVPFVDLYQIFGIVSGASITILSTIIMSIVLESIGFFKWASINLANKANGSGNVLYWYIILLSFLMTIFFNNDGSILITTPIIIQTLTLLNLKTHQKIPYLLSSALIATGSSAPIGVSNLANLIALKIVGLDLNSYAAMMFLPSMVGIFTIAFLLFVYYKKDIPKRVPILPNASVFLIDSGHSNSSVNQKLHPLAVDLSSQPSPDWKMFKICIIIVILVRMSFFLLAPLGVPTEIPAIAGAILLLAIRWYRTGESILDILKKTPWHILLFAFSMYVIIYALNNVGLTSLIVDYLGEKVSSGNFNAIFIMGLMLTVLSNLANNLPSIMIGTLSLTEMGLDIPTLQVAYLANVIGADIGSLILPMGTLASLIWMFILKQNHIPFSWGQYIRVTIIIIPIGLIISLLSLYLWVDWIYF